jgi:uncharacterized membrane protein YgcG
MRQISNLRLKSEFLGWQCRIRQISARDYGGQPMPAMPAGVRLGDAWKIGRRDVGDGLLLVVALNDRRLRIAPAKSLEGAVPDLAAQRIIDQVITPAFRQGDVAGGLRVGLSYLQARIEGEALPLPKAGAQGGKPTGAVEVDWVNLAVLLLVALPAVAGVLRRVLGQRLGALGAGGVVGVVVWSMTGLLWLGVVAAMLGLMSALFMQALPSAAVRRSQGRVRCRLAQRRCQLDQERHGPSDRRRRRGRGGGLRTRDSPRHAAGERQPA